MISPPMMPMVAGQRAALTHGRFHEHGRLHILRVRQAVGDHRAFQSHDRITRRQCRLDGRAKT